LHASNDLPELLQLPQILQMQIVRKVENVENVAVATARFLQQGWVTIIAVDRL
jgi:hypothetical protein